MAIWRTRFACWITKATNTHTHTHTHTQNIYYLFFHSNNGYANAPQCYVIRTLSVLFHNMNHDMKVCTFDTVRSIHLDTHTHTHIRSSPFNTQLHILGLHSANEGTITRPADSRVGRNDCSRELWKPSVFWAQNHKLLNKLPNNMDVLATGPDWQTVRSGNCPGHQPRMG